jgi:hypothetical protein
MKRHFVQAGFHDIRVTQAAQIEKPIENGAMRLFTIFLITGCKG